jgi:HEAT repeat protein
MGTYVRRRDEIAAESSTADVERDPELLKQVEEVFKQGASEFFQDGMFSHFSRSLLSLLAQNGRAAFRAIAEYVFSGSGNADVISEALRWLADFDDPATLPQRWAILQRTLQDRSPRVRDGAILGFAALDDPRARPLLLQTQELEPIPELQRLIQQVVDQLNATHAAPPPQR